MQFCAIKEFSPLFIPQALDFIAGYPATEGMQAYNKAEVEGIGNLLGRIRCIGYTIAHAISTPISPLIALIRVVAMPIFLGLIVVASADKETVYSYIVDACGKWKKECTSVITSPLYGIAGTVRAASGIILPSLYLKAPNDYPFLEDLISDNDDDEKFIDEL